MKTIALMFPLVLVACGSPVGSQVLKLPTDAGYDFGDSGSVSVPRKGETSSSSSCISTSTGSTTTTTVTVTEPGSSPVSTVTTTESSSACPSSSSTHDSSTSDDAGHDSGPDSGTDAAVVAPGDAGRDSGSAQDAGADTFVAPPPDSGPPAPDAGDCSAAACSAGDNSLCPTGYSGVTCPCSCFGTEGFEADAGKTPIALAKCGPAGCLCQTPASAPQLSCIVTDGN